MNHDDCEQVMPPHLMMVTLHDFYWVSVSVAFDEVMWLTAEQRKIFMTACVLYIAKSLSESESHCANYLRVIYGNSKIPVLLIQYQYF